MNAPSVDIKDMLVAESAMGLTFATNLFIGKEHPQPDSCVTIYDTPGMGPDLGLDKDEKYQHPSIQIRVRNNSYLAGWDLANDIMDALHGRAHETWNGTYYTVITCTSGPALLDWDDHNRARFIVNFEVQRR